MHNYVEENDEKEVDFFTEQESFAAIEHPQQKQKVRVAFFNNILTSFLRELSLILDNFIYFVLFQ